jgi:arylsulfatase A-like enzyme
MPLGALLVSAVRRVCQGGRRPWACPGDARVFAARVVAPSLALALGLCAAACSDSDPESAPGIVRLDVIATAPEAGERAWVSAGEIPWPMGQAGLSAEGARLLIRERVDPRASPVLQVHSASETGGFPELVTVTLRGTFDATTFNRLVIPIDCQREAYVHCTLLCKGVPMVGSTNRARVTPRSMLGAVAAGDGPAAAVVLDLPGAREFAGVPDELRLIFDNVHGPLRLGSIEMFRQPLWAWLPSAEEGFGMVALGDDARNAVGVSSVRTLEAVTRVPSRAQMRFAVGIPQALRRGRARTHFRVEVHSEGMKPLLQQLRLETDPMAESQWHRVRVPLDAYAGRRVRIVFSLLVDGGREAVCAMTRPRIETGRPEPRTVLLVTSDTHRADALGATTPDAAQRTVSTPNLDALAARGVMFEDCWSTTNVTLPSHAAIMTGTSPRDIGVFDNYTRLSREALTLSEEFQAAGFATYAVVSAPHLADVASGLGQGFDRMCAPFNVNKRRSEESISRLRAWIDDAEGQDLFVWLHVFDAHTPYEPPADFERLYYPGDRDAFDPSLPEPQVPSHFRTNLPEGVRDLGLLSARYLGEVSSLDQQLARVLDLPRIARGIVAVTADHGESLGEHGIFWEHEGLYPQSIHVPLILSWPGAPAGRRVPEPVSHLDLGRTLLSLAGVESEQFPGASLIETERSQGAARFAMGSGADRASITQDGWHLILGLQSTLVTEGALRRPIPPHRVELYDLTADPGCLVDLSGSEIDRAAELRAALCRWLDGSRPTGWALPGAEDPELRARLAQLGYAASQTASTFQAVPVNCPCAECAPFQPTK